MKGGNRKMKRLGILIALLLTIMIPPRSGFAGLGYGSAGAGGGAGGGDVTDVWGCATGDCQNLQAGASDSLDARPNRSNI
jgi:hypothetical protein